MSNYEMRFYDAEIRSLQDGKLIVEGYVNVTGSQSRVLGNGADKFVETIAKGAFRKALMNRNHDIDFLAEHNNKLILASTRNGSLKLNEDDKGLFMSAEITPTSWGLDYFKLIDSGILSNMSFGFKTIKDDWRVGKDGIYQRNVLELELYEVSVVREPAYLQSSISSRDLLAGEEIPPKIVKEKKNMEELKEMFSALTEGIRSFNERLANVEAAVVKDTEEKRNDEAVETEQPEAKPEAEPEVKEAEKDSTEEVQEAEKEAEKPVEKEAEKEAEKAEKAESVEDEKRSVTFDMNEIRAAFNNLKSKN